MFATERIASRMERSIAPNPKSIPTYNNTPHCSQGQRRWGGGVAGTQAAVGATGNPRLSLMRSCCLGLQQQQYLTEFLLMIFRHQKYIRNTLSENVQNGLY